MPSAPSGAPQERLAELLGGTEERAAELLERAAELLEQWCREHDLLPGTVVGMVRELFAQKGGSAAGLSRDWGRREAVVGIGVAAIATRWSMDESELARAAHLAQQAKRALELTGYDPPVLRGPGRDRPHGAWTAGTTAGVPRRKRLQSLANTLEAAAKALDDATGDPSVWEPLLHAARSPVEVPAAYDPRDCEPADAADPEDRLYEAMATLEAAVDWARAAVATGSKPVATPYAGWEGMAVGLFGRLWLRSGRTRHKRDTQWETAGRAWLRLLGAEEKGIAMVLREDPPPDRLEELRDAAGVRRSAPSDSEDTSEDYKEL